MGAPALLDAQSQTVLELLEAVRGWMFHHVNGGVVSDGGTTQSSGSGTAPNIDVDVTQIVDCVVNGVAHEKAATTDGDSDAGDQIAWGATSGKEAVGAVVFSTGAANDTPAVVVVFGAVAATGAAVAPTDAAVTAFLTHSNWVRLADATVERTGDTTITIAFDHTVRPKVTSFPSAIAATEAAFRS